MGNQKRGQYSSNGSNKQYMNVIEVSEIAVNKPFSFANFDNLLQRCNIDDSTSMQQIRL